MIESLFKCSWNYDTWKFNRMIDYDREWQDKKGMRPIKLSV